MKLITKRIVTCVLTFVMVFSCAVAVQPVKAEAASKKYVKSLKVSSKVNVTAGSKKTVKVTVKVSGKASKKVKVKSLNKKVVKASYSVKTKKITLKGLKKGTAKVTVTTAGKNKKGKAIKKTIRVTVKKKSAPTPTPAPSKPAPVRIEVTSVSMTESTASILKGNSKQLFATVMPDNATDRSLRWSSSAPAVAAVNSTGLVKAVSKGSAVITAENAASGKKAVCTVTVLDEVTAVTQKELEEVLSSDYAGKILLKPEAGTEIVIPSGNYTGMDLVIQAAEGNIITNNALFNSVSVSGGIYNENASENSLLITGPVNVTISESSSADIIVAVTDNSSAANVKLVNNGGLSNLAIQSAGTVSIEGSSSALIPVSISGKNVTLNSNQNMEVNATEKANLVLTGDTDQTTVTVDKEANIPDISGVGIIQCTVTETGKTEAIVADPSADLGPVDIQGAVKDAYTGNAVSDADVYLIPYKDFGEGDLTGSTVKSQKTDADGNYQYVQADSGNYYLVIQKEGYKDAVQLLTASSRFNSVYENEVMELLDTSKTGSGGISGTVKDAASGNDISGITVELRKNKGNIIGEPVETVTTDESGVYSFGSLEADQYTLQFKDQRETNEEKYILLSKNVCVKADESADGSITLSKPVKGSGIRFVLTWGSEGEGVPDDLDTHLFAPTIDGGYREVYYGSRYYMVGSQVYAMLDVDDTDYEGPETATILSDLKGIYYYYVYNFSGDGNLPTSRARVDVYSGNELLTSYNVPSTQANSGNWWKVCSYNSANGSISSYNLILDELDLTSEYTEENMVYIQSIESSSGLIDYDISREDPEGGIYIKGSQDSWDAMKDLLTVKMIDGYEAAWDTNKKDGVDAVLNILKNGQKVGYYNVYYSFSVDVDITGEGVVRYNKNESEIDIYSADSVDFSSLTYTVSDSRYEAVVADDELIICRKGIMEEVRRYNLYNVTGYYIKNVTGYSDITGFNEYQGAVCVYYKDDDSGSRNWNDVRFTFADGYTGDVVSSGDEYTLQVKNSSGSIVVEKILEWDW